MRTPQTHAYWSSYIIQNAWVPIRVFQIATKSGFITCNARIPAGPAPALEWGTGGNPPINFEQRLASTRPEIL